MFRYYLHFIDWRWRILVGIQGCTLSCPKYAHSPGLLCHRYYIWSPNVCQARNMMCAIDLFCFLALILYIKINIKHIFCLAFQFPISVTSRKLPDYFDYFVDTNLKGFWKLCHTYFRKLKNMLLAMILWFNDTNSNTVAHMCATIL